MRRRIASISSTQQITKAMQMVSSSKLRRAEAGVVEARPYNETVTEVIKRVLSNVDTADFDHPFLNRRESGKTAILVLTSNRGLCGAFNGNLIRRAYAEYQAAVETGGATMLVVGRKGLDFFRRVNADISGEFIEVGDLANINDVRKIVHVINELWQSEEISAVKVIYAWHRTTINYDILVDQLLPISQPDEAVSMQYLYEPSPVSVLGALLPSYVETMLFRALLETKASEHGARMAAMDNASRNAIDMIKSMTLQMNRLRQSSITNELTEIVSGADALQG